MTELFYEDERMCKAVAFCWETQRILTEGKFYGWSNERLLMYVESRKQQWRRFPAGVRSSAHSKFMEQLNEQLGKAANGERDSDKPVWLNEQLGWTHNDGTGSPDKPDIGTRTRRSLHQPAN